MMIKAPMAEADPFEVHFADPENNDLASKLAAIQSKSWEPQMLTSEVSNKILCLSPQIAKGEKRTSPLKRPRENMTVEDLGVKKRLIEPSSQQMRTLDSTQTSIADHLLGYRDMLYPLRTPDTSTSLRKVLCLHLLNHIFKTRDRILKNNGRRSNENEGLSDDLRDQGFARPKALILLPTKQSCVKYMDTISSMCGLEQQENRKRFEDAFDRKDDTASSNKPPDYLELFEGNVDDNFRIGIKFTRKSLKYYAKFYSSDIILASPLGLRQAMKSEDRNPPDSDFLSSIEICVVDQADALLMQNWDHTQFILDHLNLTPSDSHGCDYSRIRGWYLDGKAKHFRQTIVLSAFLTPDLNALFSIHMQNIAGKIKFTKEHSGAILDTGVHVRQTFSRFSSATLVHDPDNRYKHFTTVVVPAIQRLPQASEGGLGVLVFVPSYFDFLRVRNFFTSDAASKDIPWGSICEFDEVSDVRRTRSHFLTGRCSVLLYSGRLHHFHRYHIRGAKRLVFYGVPDNPQFYKELAGDTLRASIDEKKIHQSDAEVRVLFSRWDALALERIVGTKRVKKMLDENLGDNFEFR
ncbi:MAG: rRNA-binding ribosome biosynthesis protein utp25 [Alyxoria varia]|nr:MAG: rRNA-binding ribosome biosynthesis protein utp25 [Alyxoria varia]